MLNWSLNVTCMFILRHFGLISWLMATCMPIFMWESMFSVCFPTIELIRARFESLTLVKNPYIACFESVLENGFDNGFNWPTLGPCMCKLAFETCYSLYWDVFSRIWGQEVEFWMFECLVRTWETNLEIPDLASSLERRIPRSSEPFGFASSLERASSVVSRVKFEHPVLLLFIRSLERRIVRSSEAFDFGSSLERRKARSSEAPIFSNFWKMPSNCIFASSSHPRHS